MTSDDFYDLVARMRAYQKEYFRTRNVTNLEHSKRLEKAVDQELRDHFGSPSLFPMEQQ